ALPKAHRVALNDAGSGHREPPQQQQQLFQCDTASAALHVLATRELLETIADFMRGVPRLLTDFMASSRRCAPSQSGATAPLTRALSPFASLAAGPAENDPQWNACYDPQSANGSLARIALEQDDRRVLAMLLRLQSFPHYQRVRQLRLDMVVVWGVELGRLPALRWLQQRLPRWSAFTSHAATAAATPLLAAAVAHGDTALTDWVEQTCPSGSCSDAAAGAALAVAPSERAVDVVRWLCAHGRASSLSLDVVSALAARGCLSAVAFLHDALPAERSKRLFSAATMDAAAHGGRLDVVQFLHANRCSEGCSVAAMDGAAGGGHLDVVQFLHSHRSEGATTAALDGAAAGGHVAVVQFLVAHRREGCTAAAMAQAAQHGHLDVVRCLHHWRRAPCSTQAMDGAAAAGHLAVVRFLHEHRREGCSVRAMDLAARHGHLPVVAFLHEQRAEGCTRAAMTLAASAGHLDVVRFLHANRSEGCTPRALSLAARNGFAPVVRFLAENRTEGCAEDALRCAYRSGRFEVARYLHSRGFMGDVAKCVVSCCCSVVIRYS
ncbi:hypothetical protein PybrP1_007969, partial [[Pythium] brassicae (nom. inval.)]